MPTTPQSTFFRKARAMGLDNKQASALLWGVREGIKQPTTQTPMETYGDEIYEVALEAARQWKIRKWKLP